MIIPIRLKYYDGFSGVRVCLKMAFVKLTEFGNASVQPKRAEFSFLNIVDMEKNYFDYIHLDIPYVLFGIHTTFLSLSGPIVMGYFATVENPRRAFYRFLARGY